MAGTIVADTIQNGTGTSTSMNNAIYGSAKAWVNYNLVSQTINSSFNISSVTYNSTGNFTLNFTTALSSSTYAVCGAVEGSSGNNALDIYASGGIGTAATLKTTTQLQVYASGGSAVNATNACVIVFSS
jgi:hypothetical protein